MLIIMVMTEYQQYSILPPCNKYFVDNLEDSLRRVAASGHEGAMEAAPGAFINNRRVTDPRRTTRVMPKLGRKNQPQ